MIKRIKAPKFKVGRLVLNEYELRNNMAECAKWGNNFTYTCLTSNEKFIFKGSVFKTYIITDKGIEVECTPQVFSMMSSYILELFKLKRNANKVT